MERRTLIKLGLASGLASVTGLEMSSLRRSLASEGGAGWGYVGEAGPAAWGDLSATYSACRLGAAQSPVDLHGAIVADLMALELHYQSIPLTLFNSGHTIQVNATTGNHLRMGEAEFELQQFHFHHPSEHTLDGQAFPMEMHWVHQNGKGELAVLGVFMQVGEENAALRPVWEAMPRQKTEPETIRGITLDLMALLPSDLALFHYFGSLTTPPCSEIVSWFVLQEPISVSPAQVALFQDIFPINARPVQPLSRRFLLRSL